MSEVDSFSKKKMPNKNKKKQSAKNWKEYKKGSSNKQSNSSKGAAHVRTSDPNNRMGALDKTSCSSDVARNLIGTALNTPYISALENSINAPPVSVGNANASSVYGYGGLPIAPPPSGNSGNYLSASTHIPPAQRAGPYIPYFPQSCKTS